MTTKLKKWGNGLGIRLPKEILSEALLGENELVELIADKAGIRIQKFTKINTLDDLFENNHDKYEFHEIMDSPVGNEVW